MAASNRERVGRMFELIAPVLNAYITAHVERELKGRDWVELIAQRDRSGGSSQRDYSATDPLLQLRMLADNITGQYRAGWHPFNAQLSPVHRSYAGELRDVRNRWAHNSPFSDDDAYRALDTAERLLAAIGARDTVSQIAQLRLDLRKVTSEREDRRSLKAAAANPETSGLPPWREVLPPHDDVATGNFQASEFAADLYKVATGAGDQSRDYAEPVEFFRRTFLTEGLRDLISRAVRRLRGDDNASPVINLQTNFGGGKTHSMLALWHLAAGIRPTELPQELQELLTANGYGTDPSPVRRVALVGNHLAPSGERKSDGTQVNTLWGELAWQLGGSEAYALVAEADRTRTVPGAALHDLLTLFSPAVILIDEWVAYARQLRERDDLAGGTFETQFTFAQALTEAAKATSGILLAISIPASYAGDDSRPAAGSAEEVGGTYGLEALAQLQNVVRRVADQWRPASPDEAYHIVRQRLFTQPDGAALTQIAAVARAFGDFYRKYPDEFPREARDPAYEMRIRRTYPIHPELFERLYEDWSSLERFQRTRGVLRLMNAVIHALWVGEDSAPLIMPGSIPLGVANVNSELTQYLQDSWKAVIDADVDGPSSEPAKIDNAKPLFGQRSLTKRLARTVFFGAAPTIGSAHKGIETQRVFLGTATPGDVPGNFHSALTQLSDRATYFYSGSGKYWYDLQANITRRAKDQAERKHPEDVWADIARRLAEQAKMKGDFAGVHPCPAEHADIPDLDEARLVIVHPRLVHRRGDDDSDAMTFARTATELRGSGRRTYRNMVVFLAADRERMTELETAVRDYLGWSEVIKEARNLDLTENQRDQAVDKQQQADGTAQARLMLAYQWGLVPDEPVAGRGFNLTTSKVEGQSISLAERVTRRLRNDGRLATQQAAAAIRHRLDQMPALWPDGHVQVSELWHVYACYPYMPRLRDRQVLLSGIAEQPMLWREEGLAVADGVEDGRYRNLVLPSDPGHMLITEQSLIVHPERALAQRRIQQTESENVGAGPDGDDGSRSGTDHAPEPCPVATTRYFGSKTLRPDRYAMDFKLVADEILAPLSAAPGVRLVVRVEIEAETDDGFDDGRVRTVSENASVLRFEQSEFENG